ncbi:MAG: DUF4124 domain-containing protein, partial [Rhodanobacter sp.]
MTTRHVACAAAILLAASSMLPAAHAQNIYKCTDGGHVSYTDVPCPGKHGELLHQADDTEIIDQYLRMGQAEKAKNYADAHNLSALYTQRLAAYQQRIKERAERAADEAASAKQSAELAHQQTLADQAADSAELRAQNQLLRQQNSQYQSELSRPSYNATPLYWNPGSPYRNRPHDRNNGQGNASPDQPVF